MKKKLKTQKTTIDSKENKKLFKEAANYNKENRNNPFVT